MKDLIKASAIRALWTFCEVAVVTIGTNATFLSDVNWLMVLSASVLGFIVAFLKCLATGLPEVDREYRLNDLDFDDESEKEEDSDDY